MLTEYTNLKPRRIVPAGLQYFSSLSNFGVRFIFFLHFCPKEIKMTLLHKIFKQNRNRWQIIGAAIGAFLGIFLLLFAVQMWFDFQQILRGGSDNRFLMLNKPISLANTFFGKSVFTEKDMQNIRNQDFIKNIYPVTPNRFRVSASSQMLNFYTQLFFESVPDACLDIRPAGFRWQEGQRSVPIIVSKDYLTLYNFGFALSQGLPQFTSETIQQVRFDVGINGNGREQIFEGRIVGFSDRIRSILVPENFMTYANTQFGEQPNTGISRLLVEVSTEKPKKITAFLEDSAYETGANEGFGSRFEGIMNGVLSTIAALGVLLIVLSVFVFVLNFQLVISRSADDMRLLMQIGYPPSQLIGILRGVVYRLLGGIFLAVVAALLVSRWFLVAWFAKNDFELPQMYHLFVIALAFVLMSVILLINLRQINRLVLAL